MPISFALKTTFQLALLFSIAAMTVDRPSGDGLIGHQPTLVHIKVVDDVSRYPLANADVIDLASGRHHLTDENGSATLLSPVGGVLRLRVRQLGYQPLDSTITQEDRRPGSAPLFALQKIAVNDFAWWSGLTKSDAKRSVQAAESELEHEIIDGRGHWFPTPARFLPGQPP